MASLGFRICRTMLYVVFKAFGEKNFLAYNDNWRTNIQLFEESPFSLLHFFLTFKPRIIEQNKTEKNRYNKKKINIDPTIGQIM